MVDMIESITKLDVQSNSILILKVFPTISTEDLNPALQKLSDWLEEHDLFNVQIFIVSGEGFSLEMMSNDDLNKLGWYRKDDL